MEMIQPVLDLLAWFYANYAALIGAAVVAINALIALFMIIPGEQPEKALKAVVEFLSKFSRK